MADVLEDYNKEKGRSSCGLYLSLSLYIYKSHGVRHQRRRLAERRAPKHFSLQ
jgi:hypothetical protein